MHVTKHNELHTFSNIIFKLKKLIAIALYRNIFYVNWKIVLTCINMLRADTAEGPQHTWYFELICVVWSQMFYGVCRKKKAR